MRGMNWLFKEEPDHYSLENLFRDKRTVWDGVENNLALKHLRSVQKGDRVFFYHTGTEKAVVNCSAYPWYYPFNDIITDLHNKSTAYAAIRAYSFSLAHQLPRPVAMPV